MLDVLRVDDPSYKDPLLVGTTAHELTTEELWQAYPHRWPVETLFYIGAETTATEKPRAWTEQGAYLLVGGGCHVWEEAIESLVNPRQSEMEQMIEPRFTPTHTHPLKRC